MKFSLYPTLVVGLLIIGGCKSPMFESASNMNKPADADLNPVERFNQSSDNENGSIRPASFETLAQENRQQSSPPGRVAIEGYLKRGHIAGRQGRIGEAKKFYNLVLRNDHDNVTAHHRLAVIADKQQDFQTAERHYQTALRHQQYDPDLLADIGYSYFLQKRLEESEQYLSKALQSNPSHQRTLNNLGLLYGTLGDYNRALEMLRRTGSESEAREKLAKIFPQAESRMPTSENNPENIMFSSSGGTLNRSPVSSQFSSDSQFSNPLASRELTAPNPRGTASRNSLAGNPRSNQYTDPRGMPSPVQDNFDSSRTSGNSANPLRPAAPSTIDPHVPADTYGELSRGIDISWPQPETQPLRTTRLQPNQIMPQQYQPISTLPQPIPTDVRAVHEQATSPNRLLSAPTHAAGQTQFPNGGFTNFGKQNSYQTTSATGSYNEPFNQVNPVNNEFPEYQNQQAYTNGANPILGPSPRTNSVSPEDARRASLLGMNARPGVMPSAIDRPLVLSTQPYANPNYSISNPPAQYPSFNQSGTTRPEQWQGNRYSPRSSSAASASDFQFQQFPEGQTGNGLTAGYPNTAGNQLEAFRLYEQRRRQQNASAKSVQQFPQFVPQQQPRIVPSWSQGSQQFPAAQTPSIQLGRQPYPQGIANPSLLR